jgi:phosphate transport system substrate-binding protein
MQWNKLFTLLCVLCWWGVLQAEEIRVGGGAAPIENIFKKIKTPFEQKTGIQLVLSANGPDKALAELDSGALDVAAAGLSMKDWLALMTEKGQSIKNPSQIRNRVIGRDLIQVLTHKSVAQVKALSKEQLRDIFTGHIANWKQVGGPDLPLVLIYGSKTTGLNKVWQEAIMAGADWPSSRVQMGDAAEVKQKVVGTPGSVAIAPLASENGGDVHSPDTPEVGRPITAATNGPPSDKVQQLFDFISKDGQRYISK